MSKPEIKIQFKSGAVGYYTTDQDVEKLFDGLGDLIRDRYVGVIELTDLSDKKRTFINISEISTFGYKL